MTVRSTRWSPACAGLAAALALAACGGSSGPTASPGTAGPATTAGSATTAGAQPATSLAPAAANTIVIHSFAFNPTSLTVAPGATVTVRNEDSTTHTLTDKANAKLFTTGDIAPGQAKTFKAPTKAGRYPYICLIHQYMAGTLVVS
jgi:plastocyanin